MSSETTKPDDKQTPEPTIAELERMVAKSKGKYAVQKSPDGRISVVNMRKNLDK